MCTLSQDKKLAVITGLVEGNSIRSISRTADVDRNKINSLLLRTGERCPSLTDERMRHLPCRLLQFDCGTICLSVQRSLARTGIRAFSISYPSADTIIRCFRRWNAHNPSIGFRCYIIP